MKRVAVMLDGRFLLWKLKRRLGKRPNAQKVYDFALECVREEEQEVLFRIYYYDCPPYSQRETNPLSQEEIDFSRTWIHNEEMAFQTALARMDHVAFRKGSLSFQGWKLGPKAQAAIMKEPREVQAKDLIADLEQKQVDMKIGLDIAWLSSKSIVERIILVTGDADFIPAMKFARREGIEIVLVTLDHAIKPEMREHTDLFRNIDWPS